MTDLDALHAAIERDPFDRGAQLAYADELIERSMCSKFTALKRSLRVARMQSDYEQISYAAELLRRSSTYCAACYQDAIHLAKLDDAGSVSILLVHGHRIRGQWVKRHEHVHTVWRDAICRVGAAWIIRHFAEYCRLFGDPAFAPIAEPPQLRRAQYGRSISVSLPRTLSQNVGAQ